MNPEPLTGPARQAVAAAPPYLKDIVRFLVDPPGWVAPALLLGCLALVAVVAHRLHTRDVPVEACEDIASNLWAVAAFGTATWVSTNTLPVSFETAVVAGVTVGGAVWYLSTEVVVSVVREAYHDQQA